MNVISSIIEIMSKEDRRRFVLSLKQKNKRNDTKNIGLFQYLSVPNPQKDIDVVLYGKRSKGAYHALSKRLHDSLIDFIATKSFEGESSEEMIALKLILASRIFFHHQKNSIAFKTLAKAEIKAIKHSLFSILNEVYHTQITNAHLNENIDLNELINKYQKNKEQILLEERLNLFYASIKNELKHNYRDGTKIIYKNMKLFDISISKNLSYQSLSKILQICNEIAHVTRDYYSTLDFIEHACQEIDVSERIQDKHLSEHIQILYYLANTYFRIREFEKSIQYLENMHSFMSIQSKRYYSLYYPQYVLIKCLLLVYTGNVNNAIIELNSFDFENSKKYLVYALDLKLALIVAYFLKSNFREALKVYREFYHSDSWYIQKMGNIWVVKKNLMELLILIELDELDLVESRIKSFRKKHRNRLLEYNESRVLEFVKFVMIYYFKTEDVNSEDFKLKVTQVLNIKNKQEDIFTLSFYAWLKSKIDNTELYKTCLDYI